VVGWYEAEILSKQPGFDSSPAKTSKKYQKPPGVPFMTAICNAYFKNDLKKTTLIPQGTIVEFFCSSGPKVAKTLRFLAKCHKHEPIWEHP